jgi:hypothetical protein
MTDRRLPGTSIQRRPVRLHKWPLQQPLLRHYHLRRRHHHRAHIAYLKQTLAARF